MPKKANAILLTALLLLTLCAGCAPGGESSGPALAPGEERLQLTEEHKELYATWLRPLADNGTLMEEAQILEQGSSYEMVQDLEVVDAVLREDSITLTAVLYGIVRLDPETGAEAVVPGGWLWDGSTIQSPEDDPHSPFIPLGTSTVTLRETAAGQEVLSCTWEPLEEPGRRYLEERNQAAAAEIAASEKPDLSGYDPQMVDFVYRIVRTHRNISGPEEITTWDLGQITSLTLNYLAAGTEYFQEHGEYPVLDSGILRLMPNLRSFTSYCPLSDYSVFEGMDLETMTLSLESEEAVLDFSNLCIGHTKRLNIENFRQDIALDLSHSKVDTLSFHSWVAGANGFRGCDSVTRLEIHHTRTDTSLINAETFPNLKELDMEFMSDYARVRDFSQLSSFGEDVEINLTLTYQACNNKTVASLAGVRLDRLTLDPKNGQWPLNEPDPALVAQVNAGQVTWVEGY